MSDRQADELSLALRKALPEDSEPVAITVDRRSRSWQLTLRLKNRLHAQAERECLQKLNALTGDFTISLVQEVQEPEAEKAGLRTDAGVPESAELPAATADKPAESVLPVPEASAIGALDDPGDLDEEGWSDEPPWDMPGFEPDDDVEIDMPNSALVNQKVVPINDAAAHFLREGQASVAESDARDSDTKGEDEPIDEPDDEPDDSFAAADEPFPMTEVKSELDPSEALCRELEEQEEAFRREREERQQARQQEISKSVREIEQDDVFYGKAIRSAPVKLETITEESSGRVTVSGWVFHIETYTSRNNNSTTYRFDICDHSDSITVKVLPDFGRGRRNDQPAKIDRLGEIKKGQWVTVYGSLNTDSRDTSENPELQLFAESIVACAPPPERQDAAEPERKRVELHAHTNMSSMDALPTADALVRLAARFGHPAVAITDHGVLQSFPEAMKAAKATGIKVIYGCEIYLIDSPEEKTYRHLTVLVKNMEGLKALYDLTTEAHLNYFYRKPRILKELLRQQREHLLLGSACAAGEVYKALSDGYLIDFEQAIEQATELARFYDYLEVMPIGHLEFMMNSEEPKVHNREDLIAINKAMVEIGRRLGKPVVATSDVHFLNPEDAIYREVLLSGQDFGTGDSLCMLHLRTTEEMLAEFDYLEPQLAEEIVIENTRMIAEQIEVIQPIPDKLYPPYLDNAEEDLRRVIEETARERYGDPLPEIVASRLERELDCVIGYGYAVTYYIAHKLVQRSELDGYLVGSRGSVGSSLAATFAGITEVNPLPAHYRCPNCRYSDFSQASQYDCGVDMPAAVCPQCGEQLIRDGFNIAFETFMGFEGDKVPDIDLNFSGEYHVEAHRQCEELLGKENVFRAGTISTIAEKTAYGFALKYMDKNGLHKRKAETGRLAQGMLGVKRTTGQHPGGLMVIPANMQLHDFTPAQRPADDRSSGVITTHFDFHAIHDCLLKLDLLGHDDPTILRHLQDITGIDVRSVPLDDEKVLSLFTGTSALGNPADFTSKTGTLGVPEFGTSFVRGMLMDAQPSIFSDLVRISGFSHGTDVWLGNARDIILSGIPISGAISTRDDIMSYLISKGLPSQNAFKIMEAVRKGRGLTADDEALMIKHDVPDWYITSCKKIKYLFPKAHAVAYVTSGVRIAWFKVHQPLAFYATYFGVRAGGDFDVTVAVKGGKALNDALQALQVKLRQNSATPKEISQISHLEVACEAAARGIRFLPVDLYRSDASRYLLVDGALLAPFSGLPGVGVNAAQNIVEARRDGEFTSVENLRTRSKINKSVIEVLQNAGCLEGMEETDQLTLF